MTRSAELADEATVCRSGRIGGSYETGTKSDGEIIELMIGRELSAEFPPRPPRTASDAPPRLEVAQLSWDDRLHDISFKLHAGEVVGLGGLDGQGQRELLLALFGVLRGTSGQASIDGKPVAIG